MRPDIGAIQRNEYGDVPYDADRAFGCIAPYRRPLLGEGELREDLGVYLLCERGPRFSQRVGRPPGHALVPALPGAAVHLVQRHEQREIVEPASIVLNERIVRAATL